MTLDEIRGLVTVKAVAFALLAAARSRSGSDVERLQRVEQQVHDATSVADVYVALTMMMEQGQ